MLCVVCDQKVRESIEVIYEDNHLIVINKACGVLVQGDETGDLPLVEICKEYIKDKYHKPGEVFLGVVHRLDRPVSGVVVFARTSKALSRMNELFRSRETRKVYWAITNLQPSDKVGKLVHWLRKDEIKNKTTVFTREMAGTQHAELEYKVLGSSGGWWLLEVCPVTGRSHQIRAQLASMGSAILGDLKYGSLVPTDGSSIALHARSLTFVHPVKKVPLTLVAALPSTEWWRRFHRKQS